MYKKHKNLRHSKLKIILLETWIKSQDSKMVQKSRGESKKPSGSPWERSWDFSCDGKVVFFHYLSNITVNFCIISVFATKNEGLGLPS